MELRAVRNKAAHPFDHCVCLLPVRKMSGIRKGCVLCVGQHSEDCIQVPFGSEFIVSALKDKDRTGDTGDEISKGRFPVTEFSDTGDPRGENRIRILVVLGKRSEEHTSELQSHSYLVCRLLLEKKKTEKKGLDPRPGPKGACTCAPIRQGQLARYGRSGVWPRSPFFF